MKLKIYEYVFGHIVLKNNKLDILFWNNAFFMQKYFYRTKCPNFGHGVRT